MHQLSYSDHRASTARELGNLPFPFPSFSFSFLSFSTNCFSFFPFIFFPSLFAFLFFSFSRFSSHFPLSFSHFFFWYFSFFWSTPFIRSKEAISSQLPSSYHLCGPHISFHSPYFLILFTASHTYVAHCEPSLQVHHMAFPSVTLLGCHVASPNPCHVSSDTLRLEKREILTVSESNEIQHGIYISRDDFNGEVRFVI